MAVVARLWADIQDDGSDTDPESEDFFSPDAVRSSGKCSEESLACSETCSEEGLKVSRAWRPNVEAPEFIPTMTMTCPLVGFCEVGNPSRRRRPKAQRPLPLQLLDLKKETQRKDSKVRRSSSGASTASTATCCEDLKKETGETPSKTSKAARSPSAWSGASTTTSSGSSETSSTAGAQSEVPEATEEDWERRAQTRSKEIEKCKKFPEYRWYIEHTSKADREEDEPQTPDPLDRSISKRLWRYRLREWHTTVKRISSLSEGTASLALEEESPTAALQDQDNCR